MPSKKAKGKAEELNPEFLFDEDTSNLASWMPEDQLLPDSIMVRPKIERISVEGCGAYHSQCLLRQPRWKTRLNDKFGGENRLDVARASSPEFCHPSHPLSFFFVHPIVHLFYYAICHIKQSSRLFLITVLFL